MDNYVGYIRVSTPRQGTGVSLQAQQETIQSYAQRNGLTISGWFQEKKTAAKAGRSVFNHVMKLISTKKAGGVIIHKIDRSARNWNDWALLSDLLDSGIDVRFAHENLDLQTRGGRLSADVQAAVAVDFIRNLREETKKGLYARLRSGIYPLRAPIGYKDMGAGKPKELDPVRAPFIKKTFELYGTGRYSLESIADQMFQMGLRNRNGKRVTKNGFSTILNSPFYIGIMRISKTKQVFEGSHSPLISKNLFDSVQLALKGKLNIKTNRHEFLFRKLLKCGVCGYSLNGEIQRGHSYYRCHTKTCPTTSFREEVIEESIQEQFTALQFNDDEKSYLETRLPEMKEEWSKATENQLKALELSLSHNKDRYKRLTDAYIDRLIERDVFESRKGSLLLEEREIEENLAQLKTESATLPKSLAEFLELAGNAYLLYQSGISEEKRDLIEIITSNITATEKELVISMKIPFQMICDRQNVTLCTQQRDTPRTWTELLAKLMEQCATNILSLVKERNARM